ncbi:MAG: phosphosulfolactate synthase [Candidatus Methylomirabilales bacterium]
MRRAPKARIVAKQSGPKAWEGVFDIPVADRARKPRQIGWTMVIDKGLGLRATEDLAATAADAVDVVKLTFGTSAFFEGTLLRKKLEILRQAGIYCMPGGTFQEVCVWQGTFDRYLERAQELGFTAIEISDGTITMDHRTRTRVITQSVQAGFLTISEVGKKDPKEALTSKTMAEQVERDLELGAFLVLVEAREAGKGVGVMDPSGVPKDEEIDLIVSGLRDPMRLIWETPLAAQQKHFILRFGSNVSLGNVAPEDVLALEALRSGLRGDTLKRAWLADPTYGQRGRGR